MTRPASFMQYLRSFWRWSDKWLVQIWMGIPVLFGFIGWLGGGLDQYQDLGDYAMNAPRIERSGVIKNIDVRHRYQELFVGNERIPVTCTVPANGYCLQDIAPISAKVRYFQYRGRNVIVDIIDKDGNHLIKEKEEVASFVRSMSSRLKDTTWRRVWQMMGMSFVLVIPLIIILPIMRSFVKSRFAKNGFDNNR